MKKIVVKIGSSVIAPKGKLDTKLVAALIKDIIAVEKTGARVILVSSGAIACGLNKLGYKRKPKDTHSLMAISSIGQTILMDTFNDNLRKYKRSCGQILLSWDDFDIRHRYVNICQTIDKLLDIKAVPIINENDAVSSEEIKFGDNDWIAARVADLVGASELIILSDVDGLYDGDKLVKKVEHIDSSIKALVRREDKTHTHGGMETKLEAATSACHSGIKTRIVNGRAKNVLTKIIKGEDVGTLFACSKEKAKARKRWIFSKQIKGTITIDDGAKEALLNKGKSLLGVGIVKVSVDFKRGDAVAIVSCSGQVLGCGLVNYDSKDIKPKKRLEKEVVHRNNFIKSAQGLCYTPYRYSKKGAK
ncbi:MAG: glutamate 5-kinase [Candidatus Omnitrophica bacterium]|nr:glutamate 5-kinase [Candidatus Omnitrophota bacterium]